MTREQMYDYLCELSSEDYVSGCIAIGGYNEETLLAGLYYVTGCNSFEQAMEDGSEEFEEDEPPTEEEIEEELRGLA